MVEAAEASLASRGAAIGVASLQPAAPRLSRASD
jgi:hypothetical protein